LRPTPAPGLVRIVLGLALCLPGGFLVLGGLLLLAPGVLVALWGFQALSRIWTKDAPKGGFYRPAKPKPVRWARESKSSMTWPMPGGEA